VGRANTGKGHGGGSSANESRESTSYYNEDGPRRSKRAGDATLTAQTLLARREEELQQQRDEVSRLRRESSKQKKTIDNVKRECAGLKKRRLWIGGRYDYIMANAVRPFASSRRMHFNETSDEAFSSIVNSLLEDAMATKDLRAEVSKLQKNVSDLQRTKDSLRNSQRETAETKDLREQNQKLKKENQEVGRLRNQVQLLGLDAKNAINLRGQVQQLQRDALAKVEKVRAIPDNEFAQDFRTIVAMIKSLSRSVCPSNEVNIFLILDAGILLSEVPVERWDTRARKKCFIEAWLWSVLIELVFMTPFAIFSDDGDRISDVWSKMFDGEDARYWPTPSTQAESWRRATIEQMVALVGRTTITRGEDELSSLPLDKDATSGLQRNVLLARARVAEIITSRLSKLSPGTDISQVQKLIDRAFTLALEMSLQRSRLQVAHPAVGAIFNKQHMSPIPDRSGKDIEEGTVAFVVNPGMVKWGDAEGRNLECRYDIVASLVQLSPFTSTIVDGVSEPEQVIVKVEPAVIKHEPKETIGTFKGEPWVIHEDAI
jgi:hypothetical protein